MKKNKISFVLFLTANIYLFSILGCSKDSSPTSDLSPKEYSVSGIVSFPDGTPVDSASVSITWSDKQVWTDSIGRYTITGLKSDDYQIVVNKYHCVPYKKVISVKNNMQCNAVIGVGGLYPSSSYYFSNYTRIFRFPLSELHLGTNHGYVKQIIFNYTKLLPEQDRDTIRAYKIPLSFQWNSTQLDGISEQ